MQPPAPVLGGSRVYCPQEDIEEDRVFGTLVTSCTWRRRGRDARALRSYRRHWRRHHGHAGTA